MLGRLKAAEDAATTVHAELTAAQRQLADTKKENAQMETLLVSQVTDPAAEKKKGRKDVKPLSVEDAIDVVRLKVSQMDQQKSSLEKQCKTLQADMTAYRARYYKAN